MESLEDYHFLPRWVPLLFIIFVLGGLYLIGMKNKFYFNQIKKVIGTIKTDREYLYKAIEAINKIGNTQYVIYDYIDVKFEGSNYKLLKGFTSALGPSGERGANSQMWTLGSYYIFSPNKTSSETAKVMKDILEIAVEIEEKAIFIIKDFKKLTKIIKRDFQLLT